MKRIEFTLSMPARGSWDNKWYGEGRHFAVIKTMTDANAAKLMGSETAETRYWTYAWNDGWCAGITARVMLHGERKKKSAGFCDYDWMIDNIIDHGTPYPAPIETPAVRDEDLMNQLGERT
jgi:hypothetical protein